MKRNDWRMSLQILMTLCVLWGWWGMLYPEFTLTEDTYRIVYAEAEEEAEEIEETPRETYLRLLHTPKGQLRFRSKLLIQLQKWMEQ